VFAAGEPIDATPREAMVDDQQVRVPVDRCVDRLDGRVHREGNAVDGVGVAGHLQPIGTGVEVREGVRSEQLVQP
jgi:hypothetical protein